MSNVLIAYFSGTFGTEKVVEYIKKSLVDIGENVAVFPLDLSKVKSLNEAKDKLNDIDRLVVAYPVYAFDAPKPIFRWIKTLPKGTGIKVSVISISAGGEDRSNRTSRKHCIRKLTQKGFVVDYERMVTMPSNYAETASGTINALLLKAVPIVADRLARDISQNVVRTDKKQMAIGPAMTAGLFLGVGAWTFGKSLKTNEKCTNCKWCQNNCPTKNITINDAKMKTANRCTSCMRCVYGCPTKAIQSNMFGFTIIKDGFSIKKMDAMTKNFDPAAVGNIAAGKGWEGAINYLKDVFRE